MTGITGNIYFGLHEFNEMMLTLHFLRQGDLFVDVGANVGSYTILASGICGAHSCAFEPDPATVRHLERNVELNGIKNLVSVHPTVLGASEGEVNFTVGLDTMNRVTTEAGTAVRRVRQQRLDDIMIDRQPVMIKLDVEGHEEQVLRGARATLANQSLRIVQIETLTSEVRKVFAAHNFEVAHYDAFQRSLHQGEAAQATANTVFVRDLEFVRSRIAQAKPVVIFGRSL